MGISRRGILAGLIGVGVGGGAVSYLDDGDVSGVGGIVNATSEQLDGVVSTPDTSDKPWDHHIGNRTFDGYSFVDDRVLTIWMPPDHPSIDWVRLYHEYDDKRDGSHYETASIPRYDGTIEIDLVEEIGGGTFPTPVFEVVASRGIWANYEAIDWFTFEVPPPIAEQVVSDSG